VKNYFVGGWSLVGMSTFRPTTNDQLSTTNDQLN
jgi:hypothetical protein